MLNENLFLERYAKHIKLGGFGLLGQEALANSKIFVIGAGELGIPVLTYLATMGARTIGIAESGLISLSSLPLQPLFRYNQVGEARIQSIAQHIRDLNPDIKLDLYEHGLDRNNAVKTISGYDVVVDATNSMETGFLINDACVIAGIPLILGYVHNYEGQFAVLNFKGGATQRCLMEDNTVKEYLQEDKEQGILGILPGIIGCYMANEVVKIVSGIGDVATNKFIVINALKSNQQTIELTLNPDNLYITSLQPGYSSLEGEQADKKVQFMTPHQLSIKLSYQESIQLIDIREKDEWNFYHLEGSIHLPASDILHHLDKIHQDIPVILISNEGEISKQITDLLNRNYGYGNVYSLSGGINAWKKEIGLSMPGR